MKKALTFILLIVFNYIVISQESVSFVPEDDLIVIEEQLLLPEKGQLFNEEIPDSVKNTNKNADFICGESLIKYEGKIYHTVFYNGRCWLDRNLGANQAAKSIYDSDSYGGYFQWGRLMDGHEYPENMPILILSAIDNPGLSSFFLVIKEPYDWRDPKKNKLWSKTGGSNNPCPEGWRVPTIEELENTSSEWNSLKDAFNSPLRISASGYRSCSNGLINKNCRMSFLWSSSTDGNQAYSMGIGATELTTEKNNRAMGIPVRCIKADN